MTQNSMNRMVMKAPANCKWDESVWWRAVASQMRDMADNANCSPVESAQMWRRWAESKADEPAFASMVAAAREECAWVMQANRPKSVN